MRIIPYTDKYKEEAQRICIDTASEDNKVNPEHYAFTLMMYCDPYLDHETAFLLVDDNEQAHGYILCSENYDTFSEHMQPYLTKIRKECPNFAHRADISMYEPYRQTYPAHLHIDIEEAYTGGGNGRKLMMTLCDHLRNNNVKGVMLGVDKHNERAFQFYQKMGFEILAEDENGASLGLRL